MNELLVSFSGEIIEATVADMASSVDNWVHNVLSAHRGQQIIIGLDCKSSPHPIRSMSGKISTLQLCHGTKCLFLQLLHMNEFPQSLKVFLSEPSIKFVGIKIHENTRKLEEGYQLVCSKKVDIRALAKIWFPISFHEKSSLRALAHGVAGLCMQKTEKPYKCDWESRVLNDKLIEHACIDAYACYRIANKLIQEI
ncbi:hypothetical protein RHGRI_035503 [Rhododendron griersonianum]|uniref:3'-5' exonuclease domain-containing protein n=1 Tax=Rhododendron griersonianum TaxID=479676 RepID=A0AAV6HJG7_9ERIC|nr:hypothetical protein RHGRI_035503 [Rhododendron griersonianum]